MARPQITNPATSFTTTRYEVEALYSSGKWTLVGQRENLAKAEKLLAQCQENFPDSPYRIIIVSEVRRVL